MSHKERFKVSQAGELFSDFLKKDCRDSFRPLLREVQGLMVRWEDHCILYEDTSNRELLFGIARSFFHLHRIDSLDRLLLGISRLTDPQKSKGKENLTFQRLPSFLKDEKEQEKITKLIDELLASEELRKIRDYRNTEIGHFDLDIMTGKADSHGYEIYISQIGVVIQRLSSIIFSAIGQNEEMLVGREERDTVFALLNTLKAGVSLFQTPPERGNISQSGII